MDIQKATGACVLALALAAGGAAGAAPAFASSSPAGKCNNYARSCTTPSKVTSGGQVAGVVPPPAHTPKTGAGGTAPAPVSAPASAPSLAQLPTTGGGAPSGGNNGLLALLGAVGLSALGAGLRLGRVGRR